MEGTFKVLKQWFHDHYHFSVYFCICVFVMVLDIVVSFLVEKLCLFFTDVSLSALIGNAVGVFVGFVVQYVLCTKKVYAGSSGRTLAIFFATWVIGLLFTEAIVYVVRTLIFKNAEGMFYFLVAKFFSVVFPFFLTYFIRKVLLPPRILEESNSNEQGKL